MHATADTCASSKYLRAHLLPGDSNAGDFRGYTFLTPPGAKIASYRIHLFAATESDSLEENAYQAGLDVNPGQTPAIQFGCLGPGCQFGDPNDALAPENLLQASGLKANGLFVGVRCGAILGCTPPDGVNTLAQVRMFRSEVAIIDDDVPVVGAITGNLGSPPQPLSGARTIGGAVSDQGGGLASVVLLVDGRQFAQAPATCSEPYSAPTPCPPQVVASFDVDSGRLAPGPHTAELLAADAAGNSAVGPAVSFTVADPPPPPQPQPQPVVVPVEPTAVRLSVASTRVSIDPRGRRVAGTVKLLGGAPVAGAKVIVRSRPFGVRRALAPRRATADDRRRGPLLDGGIRRLAAARARRRRQDLPRRGSRPRCSCCSGCASRRRQNGRAPAQRLRDDAACRRRRCRARRSRQGRAGPGDRRWALDDRRGADARRRRRRRSGATASAARRALPSTASASACRPPATSGRGRRPTRRYSGFACGADGARSSNATASAPSGSSSASTRQLRHDDDPRRARASSPALSGRQFDDLDLEAFYNQAWHGLYLRLAEGEEIENHAGFLVHAAYCRAIEEMRALAARARVDAADARASSASSPTSTRCSTTTRSSRTSWRACASG